MALPKKMIFIAIPGGSVREPGLAHFSAFSKLKEAVVLFAGKREDLPLTAALPAARRTRRRIVDYFDFDDAPAVSVVAPAASI